MEAALPGAEMQTEVGMGIGGDVKAVPGEAGAGIEAGARLGLGSCPQEWGEWGFTRNRRARGRGDRAVPALPAQVRWDQLGGKAAAPGGWKCPIRFNPSLAKALPLHGEKPAFIRAQGVQDDGGEDRDVPSAGRVL